ncbi:hypothetical protein PVAP13_3NG232263 [Panicum virgatum]|uniref:Uncharacterized protein n=1 Tax=Panicum virgatum TaxID=38727 RepID=A0A8T0UF40_PANVG|nr:hypothetical protein PVAP13_3NG232263 [Panicum virgatum]
MFFFTFHSAQPLRRPHVGVTGGTFGGAAAPAFLPPPTTVPPPEPASCLLPLSSQRARAPWMTKGASSRRASLAPVRPDPGQRRPDPVVQVVDLLPGAAAAALLARPGGRRLLGRRLQWPGSSGGG